MDAQVKKAKYTLNDTGLLGDDVEYAVLVRPRPRRPSTGASRSKGGCVGALRPCRCWCTARART